MRSSLDEVEKVDLQFQIRELKLAQHHQKIADRDRKIFSIYNSPDQITHSKFEVRKNNHVGELNEAQRRREENRVQNLADEKAMKKLELLNDMILANNMEKNRQKEQMKIK